jgi:hypothetical protein
MAKPFDLLGLGQPTGAEALTQDFENVFFPHDIALCFACIIGR